MNAKQRQETAMDLIFGMAMCKGADALRACVPVPMVVAQHANMADDSSPVAKQWFVEGGICGFAWVTIPNAGSKAGRFAIKNYGARHSHYEHGAVLNAPIQCGQSMQKKEAWAAAVCRELNENGIKAYFNSRMD